jgi:hypothetical protein
VRPGRAQIAWAETASREGARVMRDGCTLCSYHFSASRRLPLTGLAHPVVFYHTPELGVLAHD